jgi:DNA adenine methylase
MSYICEKCGRGFSKKSYYTSHQNRKTPCVNEKKIKLVDEKIKQQVVIASQADTPQADNVNTPQADTPQSEIKPILKWVGGKTQILSHITPSFPIEFNNYREMFVGGGSVLLATLRRARDDLIKIRGTVYAYDLNEPLIYMYKNIQTQHEQLYQQLQQLITEFNECLGGAVNRKPTNLAEAKTSRESYYYWIRSVYNSLVDKKTILGSAALIFLNKTCFRGLFRVGPNGFNTPYGNYVNPEIINKKHLDEIHLLIQGVEFECCDFSVAFGKVVEGDFLYLDPPYAPVDSKSFTKYTKEDFDRHTELFNLIKLNSPKCKFMMSNSDTKVVKDAFVDNVINDINTTCTYKTKTILCKRSINSKKPGEKTNEVIITNY